jgi:hypothetical protein
MSISDQSKFSKMSRHPAYLRKNSYLISQTSENSNSQTKPDFWRDPAWQSAGVIITVLLSILPVFISWKQTQRKSFSYSISSRLNILDIEGDIKSKLQITFGSRNIQDLYLIIVRFSNSGNTPIIPSDFYRPIEINFGKSSEILSVEILEQSPKKLGAVTSHTSESIEVSPLLLNKGDFFEVKVLVTEFQDIFIDGRIAGVKSIEEKDLSNTDPYLIYISIITAAAVAAVTLTIPAKFIFSGGLAKEVLLGVLVNVAAAVLLISFFSATTNNLVKELKLRRRK